LAVIVGGGKGAKKYCPRVQDTLATPLVGECPFIQNATAAWQHSQKNSLNKTN